jgi:glutaryl-CoA dehydrogenase (non-decarboxylating)
MGMRLTQRQLQLSKRFKEFANQHIAPNADQFDRNERIPQELIRLIGKKGYLGGIIPRKMNGSGWDIVSYGLFCEEMGRVSASLLSLFTVHGMVSWAILKWGTAGQLDHWLPKLAAGQIIGAFALTEPEIGSDAKNIGTNASPTRNGYRIDGQKKWISCGQIADLFLVFAMCEGSPTAFLVEKTRPGLSMQPISGMLGFRSAMLSELKFNDCRIPKENLLGKVGFGFSHVVNAALDLGRYSIAWGSVGISQACTEACLLYTAKRTQFGVLLKEHQLVQQMIANMIVSTKASRLLCYQAGYLKDLNDPDSIMETATAKYFASSVAVRAALDAVQIHGANGCSSDYPVQRYLRDAKIMEIIEGSSQIQQVLIAKYGYLKLDV